MLNILHICCCYIVYYTSMYLSLLYYRNTYTPMYPKILVEYIATMYASNDFLDALILSKP